MTTTTDNVIEVIRPADEPLPADFPLALVHKGTKERAKLAALEAIATPVTIERRDILLKRASAITAVGSEEDVTLATEVAGLLKGLRNDVEQARKRLKDPVLAIGSAIDEVAKSVKDAAEAEMKRLEKMMGDYRLRQELARQAEIRRQEELARQAREKAEREAEAARKAAEKARQEAEELTKKADAGEADLLDAIDAEARAEEAAAQASAAVAQTATPIYAPIAPAPEKKIAGAAVATDWDFEITDISALYAAKPECVELKPRPSVIKAVIKAAAQQAGGNAFSIPGLRISPKVKVATRAR